ncbi:hypothetical protein JI743_04760 [Sphingopyxis sp. DHUNG17]|nr:hypothetical protein [Sphingopyxis lutea]MBL0768112.1 hypothetical protein [Sphingopyxis lutea]
MDKELRLLSKVAAPTALDTLDDRILSALALRREEAMATRRLVALVALFSLGTGVVAGSAVPQPAVAASPLSPFGPASALAPSTLLEAP